MLKGQLNRDKISDAIQSYDREVKITGPKISSDNLHIYQFELAGEPVANLNINFNKDATTSLTYLTGKNHNLSKSIAEHIFKNTEYQHIDNSSFYIKKLPVEDFNLLKEFMTDLYSVKIEEEKKLGKGVQFKANGKDGDYILLNYFNNNAFQVQGKSDNLKAIVIEGLGNLLPYREIIEAQLVSLKVTAHTDDVLSELEQILPESFQFLGDKIITIISPSVPLRRLEANLLDYSVIAFPALKGLEGYIKKLFFDKDIIIEASTGFICFEKSAIVKLNEETREKINNEAYCRAIENAYHYFKKHRHGLFHVDGIIETTKTIGDKQQAVDMVQEIFHIIESTYKIIKI